MGFSPIVLLYLALREAKLRMACSAVDLPGFWVAEAFSPRETANNVEGTRPETVQDLLREKMDGLTQPQV